MNCLSSQSYRYRAINDHPSHAAHWESRCSYGNAIKRAKEQHWKAFLESIAGKDLWTAHQYTTGPIGDGSKARIPMLKVTSEDGTIRDVSSNEEKSGVLHCIFFPGKPVGNHMLPDSEYPNWVNYSFFPLS